ncbi:MAG: EcsC family protein [Calditrichaeota bacterium]|nr:EcsC family protein [Calditrichota bacterium]
MRRNKLTENDLLDLQFAKQLLENPGLAARLTDALAKPIERGFRLLPPNWLRIVNIATKNSLEKGLHFAVASLGKPRLASEFFHKIVVGTSGALGGAFGISGLAVELPVSTVIMLRSIADIARSEGEDLNQIESRLSCLEVFALGGKSTQDDAAETGYYAVRLTLSKLVTDAASFIAQTGTAQESAPALVRLISAIASRFGTVVSEKVAAMAIPLVGAVGGATVNTLFIDHFQRMARGHFIVRRLERIYGQEVVQRAYENLE